VHDCGCVRFKCIHICVPQAPSGEEGMKVVWGVLFCGGFVVPLFCCPTPCVCVIYKVKSVDVRMT